MRTAIFDLDGTLADTTGDLIAAANGCFDRAWLDPVADAPLALRGGQAMLQEILRRQGRPKAGVAEEARALRPRFLEVYRAGIADRTFVFEGVEPALDALAGAGWCLGVCTNKPVGLAELLLERLGLRARFAAVLGMDSLPVHKPDPDHLWHTIDAAGGARGRAVLIGDSDTDFNTARAAGTPIVLLAFGPNAALASTLTPDARLRHFEDLPDLLDQLVPAEPT